MQTQKSSLQIITKHKVVYSAESDIYGSDVASFQSFPCHYVVGDLDVTVFHALYRGGGVGKIKIMLTIILCDIM